MVSCSLLSMVTFIEARRGAQYSFCNALVHLFSVVFLSKVLSLHCTSGIRNFPSIFGRIQAKPCKGRSELLSAPYPCMLQVNSFNRSIFRICSALISLCWTQHIHYPYHIPDPFWFHNSLYLRSTIREFILVYPNSRLYFFSSAIISVIKSKRDLNRSFKS